jgi:hypothetical protein
MSDRRRSAPVVDAWRALPYQGRTFCQTCGEPAFCAGLNPDSRVCVGCFEFAHSCRAPNYRRRRKPRCGS